MGHISVYSLSVYNALPRLERSIFPILPICMGIRDWYMPFPRALVWSEIKTVPSTFWIWLSCSWFSSIITIMSPVPHRKNFNSNTISLLYQLLFSKNECVFSLEAHFVYKFKKCEKGQMVWFREELLKFFN